MKMVGLLTREDGTRRRVVIVYRRFGTTYGTIWKLSYTSTSIYAFIACTEISSLHVFYFDSVFTEHVSNLYFRKFNIRYTKYESTDYCKFIDSSARC